MKQWTELEFKLLCVMIAKRLSLKHCAEVLGRRESVCQAEFHRAATCDNRLLIGNKHAYNIWQRQENLLDNVRRKNNINFGTRCRHFN